MTLAHMIPTMRVPVVVAIALPIALAAAKPAFAQSSSGSSATPAVTAPQGTPVVDLGDLWHRFRHDAPQAGIDAPAQSAKRPFFFLSPSISSKPSTGLSFGVASSLVFVTGDPATTHLSSGDWSANASVKHQTGTAIRFRIFTPENRWLLQGDDRLAWTAQTTYALGILPGATGERIKFNRTRLYEAASRRVRPNVLIGAGVSLDSHSNIRPATPNAAYEESAYAAYSHAHGFALDEQNSNGLSVNVLVDTRNNAINATRGWFASATYRTFIKGFAGGTSTWQRLETEGRTYKTLDREARQTIAVWFLGEFVTGGAAPYFDLPSIADDTYGRSARGYTTGRYRGPHMLYGEVEYRAALVPSKLLGAALFANVTAVDGLTEQEHLFDTLAPAAGAGLRILLSKRSRANLCLDYGWGRDGSHGFYLAMKETF
jgi:hypothetical protein